MKNIIITGTSRGIGYKLALQFAEEGHQVLAVSRQTPQELIDNPNITCLSIDIAVEDQMQEIDKFIASTWKKVDVLINNAGCLVNKPFSQLTQSDFERVYKVNVFGVANLIRTCIPYMQKGSHVVSVSSMGGIQGSMKFPGFASLKSRVSVAYFLSSAEACIR